MYSTSTNGTTWSAVTRVPIDVTTSGVDHFIPGLGVDKATSGTTAKLGLYYYFYPTANCSASTCQMAIGYISSANGGSTWGAPTTVAGPFSLSRIANTSQGTMIGDYISASVVGGNAYALLAIGKAQPTAKRLTKACTPLAAYPSPAAPGARHRPDLRRPRRPEQHRTDAAHPALTNSTVT